MFKQVGVTADGRPVLAGLYKVLETYGVPLDVLLLTLEEKGAVPSFLSFYDDAKAAGMKHDRIISKLSEALSDAHGPRYRDEVLTRLLQCRVK